MNLFDHPAFEGCPLTNDGLPIVQVYNNPEYRFQGIAMGFNKITEAVWVQKPNGVMTTTTLKQIHNPLRGLERTADEHIAKAEQALARLKELRERLRVDNQG